MAVLVTVALLSLLTPGTALAQDAPGTGPLDVQDIGTPNADGSDAVSPDTGQSEEEAQDPVLQEPELSYVRALADASRETPGGMGLLPTAAAEADIAVQHARLALADSFNVTGMRRHAGHVIHALDPSVAAGGPGMGFGVRQAAAAATPVVEMVSASASVSRNVSMHSVRIAQALSNVDRWTGDAIAIAQQIQSTSSVSAAAPLVARLVDLCEAIAYGRDGNGDGIVGWEEGEGGLAQARYHMSSLKRGEGLAL